MKHMQWIGYRMNYDWVRRITGIVLLEDVKREPIRVIMQRATIYEGCLE